MARKTNAAEFFEHAGLRSSVDWGTEDLTNETASSVQTKLLIVESCITSIEENAAGTPAHYVLADIPDQTVAANQGKVNLSADTVGGTTSGTTKCSWVALGYGKK